MQLALTIFSATAYGITLTPLTDPSAAYTYYGNYSGPINYVNFREYDRTVNSSPTDTANNFEISQMFITPVPEPPALRFLAGWELLASCFSADASKKPK